MHLFQLSKNPKSKAKEEKEEIIVSSTGRGGSGNIRIKRIPKQSHEDVEAVSITSSTVIINTALSPPPVVDHTISHVSHINSEITRSGSMSYGEEGADNLKEQDVPVVQHFYHGRGGAGRTPMPKAIKQIKFQHQQNIIHPNPERGGGSSTTTGRGGLGNIERGNIERKRAGSVNIANPTPIPDANSRRLSLQDFGRPLSSIFDTMFDTMGEEGDPNPPRPSISSLATSNERHTPEPSDQQRPTLRVIVATDRATSRAFESCVSLSSAEPQPQSSSSSAPELVSPSTLASEEALTTPRDESISNGNIVELPSPDTPTLSRASSMSLPVAHAVAVPLTMTSGSIIETTQAPSVTSSQEVSEELEDIPTIPIPPQSAEVIEASDVSHQPLLDARETPIAESNSTVLYSKLGLWAGLGVGLVVSSMM